MADLSVEFCGVRFENPLVLASGILGITGDGLARVVENGAGGVTSKSLWSKEHVGHVGPNMFATESWMMNAVGLPDAGPEKAREEIVRYRAKCDAPFIANIVGGDMEDFEAIAALVPAMKPDIIELNISCPNVHDEFGKPMACSVVKAKEVTERVKKVLVENGGGDIPFLVKLSPNVESITSISTAVMEGGADGLTAINTYGPALMIDIETAQPILQNKRGGLSGPAIKPLAVMHVFDLYAAHSCPIIGTGGVTTGRDAIEMMMAGATLVGMGSAVHYRGQQVFAEVAREMNDWCDANGVERLRDVIGKAHTV